MNNRFEREKEILRQQLELLSKESKRQFNGPGEYSADALAELSKAMAAVAGCIKDFDYDPDEITELMKTAQDDHDEISEIALDTAGGITIDSIVKSLRRELESE